MCGIDAEAPSCMWETHPRARKEHRCCECHSVIGPGEKHQLIKGVWDGRFATYRTCAICETVRKKAMAEYRSDEGIAFGCLWEETGVEFESVAAAV